MSDQTSHDLPLDKSAFALTSHEQAANDDAAYWATRTPLERLIATERIRQAIYGYDPATARFQRSFEIVKDGRG